MTTTRSNKVEQLARDVNSLRSEVNERMDSLNRSIELLQESIAELQRQRIPNNGGEENRISNNRFTKIDFPKFYGEDVDGWLYKCDHFFTIDETPDDRKVRYAALHLDGRALSWHLGHVKSSGKSLDQLTWDEYSRSITARFSDHSIEDATGTLEALTQDATASVTEFTDRFKKENDGKKKRNKGSEKPIKGCSMKCVNEKKDDDRLYHITEGADQNEKKWSMQDLEVYPRFKMRDWSWGFVMFLDPAVAERVVKEKHMIDGSTVEAKKDVPRDDQQVLNRSSGSIQGSPGPIRTKKIFVGGLASSVTESDFKTYFDQFGIITDVVVMYDHNTQRPRGFGFITYESEESVDKALLRTFHELNGKMVEVKRAVPKESSPSPNRNQISGINQGLSRVNSFLNYGFGARMDGRFSLVSVGRTGYPPFSPSSYNLGLSSDSVLGMNYGGNGNGNFSSNLGYGCMINPIYSGMGGSSGSGGVGYVMNSMNHNLWGNGNQNFTTNSSNFSNFLAAGIGSGGIGEIWGSSNTGGNIGGGNASFIGGNLNYGNEESTIGYKRNNGNNSITPAAYSYRGNRLKRCRFDFL